MFLYSYTMWCMQEEHIHESLKYINHFISWSILAKETSCTHRWRKSFTWAYAMHLQQIILSNIQYDFCLRSYFLQLYSFNLICYMKLLELQNEWIIWFKVDVWYYMQLQRTAPFIFSWWKCFLLKRSIFVALQTSWLCFALKMQDICLIWMHQSNVILHRYVDLITPNIPVSVFPQYLSITITF